MPKTDIVLVLEKEEGWSPAQSRSVTISGQGLSGIKVGQQRPEEHPESAGVVDSCGLSLRSHVGIDGVEGRQRIPGQHYGLLQVSREVSQGLLVVVGNYDVTVDVLG